MKNIIITGTPGTGKTTLSKKLAKKLNFHYLDVNLIIKKYRLSEGYDKKRKTKIIDVKKLNKAMVREINKHIKRISNIERGPIKNSNKINNNKNKEKYSKTKPNSNLNKNKKIKNGLIIDSHLSHYLPKKYADLCIVTKCSLKTLKHRLEKKGYSENKARENLDAEIFDICLAEARENKHKVLIIDTTKGINIGKISKKAGGLIGIRQG